MTVYMDTQARELLDWLKARYEERPTYGWQIDHISQQLGWTYQQTKYAIDYTRKQVTSEEGQVICFKKGRAWYYKLPSAADADTYVEQRGAGVARMIANVLFLVRKGLAKWGDRPYLVSAETHLIAILEEMIIMGIPGVDDMLTWALRPIGNGSPIA